VDDPLRGQAAPQPHRSIETLRLETNVSSASGSSFYAPV
jgi:hypothetical protein